MLRVIELFAGIGAQAQALKEANIEFETVAIAEIDKYAVAAYEAIHGPVLNLGDVSAIDIENVPDCDLITYSFPCQDISVFGYQKGLDEGSGTRSSLLWECKKIIEAKRPKYLLMENVKNLVSRTHKANFDKWLAYLSSLGYTNYWKVLNAVDYGIPQARERVFVVSILGEEKFEFPKPIPRVKTIEDIMLPPQEIPENKWLNNYTLTFKSNPTISPKGLMGIGELTDLKALESGRRVYSTKGACPTLTALGGGYSEPKIYNKEFGVRMIVAQEFWRLMGFSDEAFNKVKNLLSDRQLRMKAGNSICVPCLTAIFRSLLG